ncbi:hypothetical protein Nepgr_029118 [Nepenthes gracilis]|uniref:Uncharacterized protein n=1 Tax=Nepenthes gracilis TaxID=150966 RepID=A0AAD3TBU0_NEPGR|nr:hypothetical protein Nepgr_029118 [Nepenthes gracilis]
MLGTLSTIFGCFQPSRVSSYDHHHDDGGRCSNMESEPLDEEMKKLRMSEKFQTDDEEDGDGEVMMPHLNCVINKYSIGSVTLALGSCFTK